MKPIMLAVAAALVCAGVVYLLLEGGASERVAVAEVASASAPIDEAAAPQFPGVAVAPTPVTPAPMAASQDEPAELYVEARQELAADRAMLVDAREMVEWDKGHLDGAVIFPTSWLEGYEAGKKPNTIPADKIIYVYASTGAQAKRAAQLLLDMGFDARPFEAGFAQLSGSFASPH